MSSFCENERGAIWRLSILFKDCVVVAYPAVGQTVATTRVVAVIPCGTPCGELSTHHVPRGTDSVALSKPAPHVDATSSEACCHHFASVGMEVGSRPTGKGPGAWYVLSFLLLICWNRYRNCMCTGRRFPPEAAPLLPQVDPPRRNLARPWY